MTVIKATHDDYGDIVVEITESSVEVSGDAPADIQKDVLSIENFQSVTGDMGEDDATGEEVSVDVYEPADVNEKTERVIIFLETFGFEITEGRQNRALGEGVTDQELQHAPEWDRPLLEMYRGVTDPNSDPDRALVSFAASGTPEFVLERVREAIMGGALFSDFAEVSSDQLMDFRQEFADALGTDNFTLDDVTDRVMDFAEIDRADAERIARTETSAALNSARERGYEERGEGDELFYWTGASPGDDRQTEACEWLITQTNPFEGGTPRPMDELRDMLAEAPRHDDDMQNDLARPGSWVVHPNERSTFAKAPPGWESL